MSEACPSCQGLRQEIDGICDQGSHFPVRLDVRLNMIDAENAAKAAKTKSWKRLQEKADLADLVVRAERMYYLALQERKKGEEGTAFFHRYTAFVEAVGSGLLEPFRADPYREFVRTDGPEHAVKLGVLGALQTLSDRYAGRVPSLLWQALAFVALRDDAFIDRSIIGDALRYRKTIAPWHYTFYDACLHALGKVYSLLLDVQTEISRQSGVVLIHNCDCGCSLVRLARGGSVDVPLGEEFHRKATESFMTHVLAEGVLILRDRLPFVTGVGDDAKAALELEAEGLL